MKLNEDQAVKVIGQVAVHASLSNADAQLVQSKWMAFIGTSTDFVNDALEAGDPFVTRLVAEMVMDRMSGRA